MKCMKQEMVIYFYFSKFIASIILIRFGLCFFSFPYIPRLPIWLTEDWSLLTYILVYIHKYKHQWHPLDKLLGNASQAFHSVYWTVLRYSYLIKMGHKLGSFAKLASEKLKNSRLKAHHETCRQSSFLLKNNNLFLEKNSL